MAQVGRTQPSVTWSIPKPAQRWLVPLALALVVAGIGGAWLLRPAFPSSSSAEAVFARDMAAHHAQAVEMATIIRDRTTNEELRYLTLDMILTQQAQIGQMQGWLAVWQQPLAVAEPPMNGHAEHMGMATAEQIDSLRTLPVEQAEERFLQLMIRHHQGALVMVNDVLARTSRPEVVELATSIKNGQSSEIRFMEKRLNERGAALPEPLAPMNTDEEHQH
jgi:uncharacterized protein (DUF305 family)